MLERIQKLNKISVNTINQMQVKNQIKKAPSESHDNKSSLLHTQSSIGTLNKDLKEKSSINEEFDIFKPRHSLAVKANQSGYKPQGFNMRYLDIGRDMNIKNTSLNSS